MSQTRERAPRRPSQDPKTYNLPPLIAAAVSTNRGQLCENFAASIMVGTPPPSALPSLKQIADMGRLIGDLLEDRSRELLRIHDLNTQLKSLVGQVRSFQASVQDALGHVDGVDLEDDDDDDQRMLREDSPAPLQAQVNIARQALVEIGAADPHNPGWRQRRAKQALAQMGMD